MIQVNPYSQFGGSAADVVDAARPAMDSNSDFYAQLLRMEIAWLRMRLAELDARRLLSGDRDGTHTPIDERSLAA